MSEKGAVLKNTTVSTPPGVLNHDQIGRFKTIQEDIAELPIKTIQPHRLIPDYRDPTESTLPTVVQSPEGSYCIDGWNLIKQAMATGQPAIRCWINTIQEHSDTELAIRKVEVRTKPRNGTCSSAELVRNASILEKIILDEMENAIVFSHGGTRRGESFSGNEGDDLRIILCERLGKTRSTINDYLNFGKHLTVETMNGLVVQNTSKDFFEKARINKRLLIKNLESDDLTHDEITAEVSRKILDWRDEYQRTKNIVTDYGEERPPEEENEANDQGNETVDDENDTGTEDFEIFRRRSLTAETEVPDLPTEESVKIIIQSIINELSDLRDQSPLDCDKSIEIVDNQIEQLATVQQLLMDIRDRVQQNQDTEAS